MRNTLPVIALVGAFALLGAGLFLAEAHSQASAQGPAAPTSGAAHPQPTARKASIAAAVHPRLADVVRFSVPPPRVSVPVSEQDAPAAHVTA